MTAPVVAPSGPTRFVSVLKPELGILELRNEDGSEGDVWPCESCGGTGVHEVVYGEYGESGEVECCRDYHEGCDGTGWVHGYDNHGRGMPARPVGDS